MINNYKISIMFRLIPHLLRNLVRIPIRLISLMYKSTLNVFRQLPKFNFLITALIFLSFAGGRNISPFYTDIENFVGSAIAMKKNSDTSLNLSFDTSILWEEPTMQAISMIVDRAIHKLPTLNPHVTNSLISAQGTKFEGEDISAIERVIALSRLTGIPHTYWTTLDKLSQPFVRNLTSQTACALWFGYCGPSLFIYNIILYTSAQLLSTFTSVPGAQIFNLYRVYLQYSMFGLLPASRALFFTVINQLTDWASPVQNPISLLEKAKNFVAKNKGKIKIGLFAANTLYWGVSKLFSWFNSSSNIDEISRCSGAIDTLNEAIKSNKGSPKIEELTSNSTVKMVTKAYRALAKVFHPDMKKNLPENKKISTAKDIWLKVVQAKDFFMNNRCTK